MIYSTTDPKINWNGQNTKGVDASEGVYYLLVEIEDDPSIPDYKNKQVFTLTLVR